MNAETRNDAHRAAFFGMGRGDWLADMSHKPGDDPKEAARLMADGLRGFITPEQRLINIAEALVGAVESRRHEGRSWEIKSSAAQLRDELIRYFHGKLPPTQDDGLPF